MVNLVQQFFIIMIILFCLYMIYFYFRNKSKKYKNVLTTEINYLVRIFGINPAKIGLSKIQKHIAIINSIIISIDLLFYFNLNNTILKLLIVFVVTFVLIMILYNILGIIYKKKYR